MNDEIYNQIKEDASEVVYDPRPRKKDKQVNHQTVIGEIVYGFLRGRNYPLLYQKANDYASEAHQKGYQWWTIELKLKAIMEWGKSKNVHPLAIIKILNRGIR